MPKRSTRPTVSASFPLAQHGAEQLRRHGYTVEADAVETVLAYAAGKLKSSGGGTPNWSVSMERALSEHVKDVAQARGTTVTKLVNKGLEAIADGEWHPGALGRVSVQHRVSLNLRPDPELMERAEAVVPGKLRQAVAAYLVHECGLPEGLEHLAPAYGLAEPVERRQETVFTTRERLDRFQAGAAAEGVALAAVAKRALAEFVDGSWVPAAPAPRAPIGASAFPQKTFPLKFTVDAPLLDTAASRAVELAAERGWERFDTPARVVLAYLVERYGLPDAETAQQ